jgi:hypothetical protein
MINDYIKNVKWQSSGGEYPFLNCWGLARIARHELYGKPLLPSVVDVDAIDKNSLTEKCNGIVCDSLKVTSLPKAGDLATVWRNKLCQHIALVIEVSGRLGILEIVDKSGPRWMWLTDWERRQSMVIYYADN